MKDYLEECGDCHYIQKEGFASGHASWCSHSRDKKKKILIVSDAPSGSTGLGRIARDLGTLIQTHLADVFELGWVGYGGTGAKRFHPEYHVNTMENWMIPELPQIVEDFAPGEEVILFFISDPSRLEWFAYPEKCGIPHLSAWLKTAPIRKWIYAPVDAEGPNGKLCSKLASVLKGFDRVLNYSQWSAGVTGYPDWLPHGIDTSVFKPFPGAKQAFRASGFRNLAESDFLLGIVATNQARKDWALGIETSAILLKRGLPVKLWCHVDDMKRDWDIPALLDDFGLEGRYCISTTILPDEFMAKLYSACDVTLGIGLGEGFGYPIFESLACWTPCIHGSYGGAAEHLPESFMVPPAGWRHEGPYCSRRPVFSAADWADRAEVNQGILASLPEHMDWNGPTLKNSWNEWLKAGI